MKAHLAYTAWSLCLWIQFILFNSVSSATSESKHTNNWAVIVDTSRFWFNYRHEANALSVYRSVKRLGIPDSHIILMLADDVACDARNSRPAAIYNNARQQIDVYGTDVEVDYRGYEVNAESFVRVLTGRVPHETPRSKRLLSDDSSNILIYMTGHGGNGFIKFQDSEEISSDELVDVFEQMRKKLRYRELLFIVDTCQAESLFLPAYSPGIVAIGSSRVGEDSLSHHTDPSIGVYVIDRFTYYMLEFLERVPSPGTKYTGKVPSLADLFACCPQRLCVSNVAVRSDLYPRDPAKVPITDFFGATHPVIQLNSTVFHSPELEVGEQSSPSMPSSPDFLCMAEPKLDDATATTPTSDAVKQSSSLNEIVHLILAHAESRESPNLGNEATEGTQDQDEWLTSPYDPFWSDMLVAFFLNPQTGVADSSASRDDMVFFVCQVYNETERARLEVYRRGSPRIPLIGHPGYNWQETFYLNLIMQQFEYLLTLAICTRTGHNELEILRKHTLPVFASPSRRRLDSKGSGEEIVYPHIFFIVDNFDEIYEHMTVGEGELVCVELVAHNKNAAFSTVVFLGSVRYEVLWSAFQARRNTVSSRFSGFLGGNDNKPQQSSSFAFADHLLAGLGQNRLEFVRMRGPHNKGSAEVAVTQIPDPAESSGGFGLSRRFAGSMSVLASMVTGSGGQQQPASGVGSAASNWAVRKSYSQQGSDGDSAWAASQQQQADQQQSGGWLSRSISNAFGGWGRNRASTATAPGQQPTQMQSAPQSPKLNSRELKTYLTYVSLPWHKLIEDILEPSSKPVLTTF